jgi:hypothetical protein
MLQKNTLHLSGCSFDKVQYQETLLLEEEMWFRVMLWSS